jgi:hypothetical protein
MLQCLMLSITGIFIWLLKLKSDKLISQITLRCRYFLVIKVMLQFHLYLNLIHFFFHLILYKFL